MLNSFMGVETLSRGLFIQQLNQSVTATNLAKTYRDSNGYLITSRQRVEIMEGSPLFFGSLAGRMAIGTGPLAQQITRLRSSFLDSQIQQQSTVVGKAEILSDVLNQIKGIVNASTGTLNTALTNLTAAWTALAVTPLSVALRSAVVNAGVAFANLSRNQFTQLIKLQTGLNDQINQTVTNINQLLQQLSSLNSALLTSQGANVNDLLDARDYTLDKLSRLVNIQTNFGTAGTVSVYLGSSSLPLVDSGGASIVQINIMNQHNPGLVNVTIQTSNGSVITADATSMITGGNLGGELQARDVLLEGYKTQLDQVTTSVMNVTNIFHQAGYAADGLTTNTPFFTGTTAQDINVNAALVSDPTRALLAASSRQGITTNGQIAQFLGDLPNLLANNYMVSQPPISNTAVNPWLAISTQAPPLVTTPAAAGTFNLNMTTVSWTNADSIYAILDKINAADPNVHAVYNYAQRSFYLLSNNPIVVSDITGNFTSWANTQNVLVSSVRMNNGFTLAPAVPQIVPGQPLNSPNNTMAFRVTPGTSGTFILNGVSINWTNTQSFNLIRAAILGIPGMGASFSNLAQTFTLYNQLPIQIIDTIGNFTVFTGLNANTPIGYLSAGILTQITGDLAAQQLTLTQASASLTQLNNAQADIGAVALVAGDRGVPIQVEQENAIKSLIAFNAALQVLHIMDQMYADLVSIVGGTPPGGFFQTR